MGMKMKQRTHLILLDLMSKHGINTQDLFLTHGRPHLRDFGDTDALSHMAWHDIVGFTISHAKDVGWSGTLNLISGARIGTPDQQPRTGVEQAERDIALIAAALRFGMADKPSEWDGEAAVNFDLDGELFTLEWFDIQAETDRAVAWARTAYPEAADDAARIDEIVEDRCRKTLESVAERIQDPDLCDHEERALYARLVTAVLVLAGRGVYSYECYTGRHAGPGSNGFPDQPGLGHSPG
jgi:hypothetical protein